MNHPVRHLLQLAVLLLVAAHGRAAPAAENASPEIKVRVYEGVTDPHPEHGSRSRPYALDVGTTLTTCPDGNTAAQALDIGGQRHPLGEPCSDHARESRIRVDAGSVQSGTPATEEPPAGMRCDPGRWRCQPQAP